MCPIAAEMSSGSFPLAGRHAICGQVTLPAGAHIPCDAGGHRQKATTRGLCASQGAKRDPYGQRALVGGGAHRFKRDRPNRTKTLIPSLKQILYGPPL